MEEQEKSKSITAKVLSIVSMAFLVLCVGILVYSTISYTKNGLVNFFGYSFHVIQTESMDPEIKVGDLVVVKKVPYSEINIGDDILFKSEDTTSAVYGKYVVHRVVALTENEGVYKTRGINNLKDDDVPSRAEGKVVKVSSTFGSIFSFLTNSRNLVIIIAIVGLLIFTFFQICSVIANASKLKEEKGKEKMQNDEKLKEQLKQELLEEMQIENQQSSGDNIDKQKTGNEVSNKNQSKELKAEEEYECKYCGAIMSKNERACPSCGARKTKSSNKLSAQNNGTGSEDK